MIPSPPDWLDKLVAAGPATIFAFLFFYAEWQRRGLQDKFEGLLRENLQITGEFKSLLQIVAQAVTGRKS